MSAPDLIPAVRRWLGTCLGQICPPDLVLHWQNMPAPIPPAGAGYMSVSLQPDGEGRDSLLGPQRLLSGQILLTLAVPQGDGTAALDALLEVLRRDLAGQEAGWIRLAELACGAAYARSIYHCQDASLAFIASEETIT